MKDCVVPPPTCRQSRCATVAGNPLIISLALLAMWALVIGIKPRVLAQEQGPAPQEAGVCYICSGAPAAASAAPATDSVALPPPPPLALMPVGSSHVVLVPHPPPQTLLIAPSTPPPRA